MTRISNLPAPQKNLGFSLMAAIEKRRSKRKWQDSVLSKQELSNLLWSACGITREETKRSKSRRTAPSAMNSQEIKVYVAKEEGIFLYDEKEHNLRQINSKDIRKNIGTQKMMQKAPLGLIYVSDFSRLKRYTGKDEERRWFVSGTDTAFISQNVYLYCAASGLNTVILGLVDRKKLHEVMGLKKSEKVIYTQVVGKA